MSQRKPNIKIHISETELRYKYCELQLSRQDIAGQYNCSKVTIRARLREYNIPIRSSSEALKIINYRRGLLKRWDNPATPRIGEVRRKDNKNGKGKNYYVWTSCIRCGKTRWVAVRKKSEPVSKHCLQCRNVEASRRWTGENSPNWKGGRRVTSESYIEVRVSINSPYYAMIKTDGYIKEHRLIMAKHLGRCLLTNEIVHHKNGIRDDNRLENLELVARENHRLGYRSGYEQGLSDTEHRIETLEKQISLHKWQIRELNKNNIIIGKA